MHGRSEELIPSRQRAIHTVHRQRMLYPTTLSTLTTALILFHNTAWHQKMVVSLVSKSLKKMVIRGRFELGSRRAAAGECCRQRFSATIKRP